MLEWDLPPNTPLTDGMLTYAHQQAALECEISAKWTLKWRGTRKCAIPIIHTVMSKEWVVHDDDEMSMDYLANGVIELELSEEAAGDLVGSDCED